MLTKLWLSAEATQYDLVLKQCYTDSKKKKKISLKVLTDIFCLLTCMQRSVNFSTFSLRSVVWPLLQLSPQCSASTPRSASQKPPFLHPHLAFYFSFCLHETLHHPIYLSSMCAAVLTFWFIYIELFFLISSSLRSKTSCSNVWVISLHAGCVRK